MQQLLKHRMENPEVDELGVRNDGGGADWKHTVTFLSSRGRTYKQRRLLQFGHDDAPLLRNRRFDGDGFRKNHFVRNRSS